MQAELADIGFGANMNDQVKLANEKRAHKAAKYFDDMSKLTPTWMRYENSLSGYILQKVMEYCTKTIFNRKRYYLDKYKMKRKTFIKVFNLYCSLSFISILRKLKKSQSGGPSATPQPSDSPSEPKKKAGKGGEPEKKKTRNLQDFSDAKIEGAGIDIKTLMNEGFPQLRYENSMVIEKIFENIRKEVNPKTGRVNFDAFIELVHSFSSNDVDTKVERFFKLIDEDGNGELSYEEILHLCQRSFQTMKDSENRPQDEGFYEELAQYFAGFIFRQTGVDMEDEITPDELKAAIQDDQDGADLLEMFCGEALICLD